MLTAGLHALISLVAVTLPAPAHADLADRIGHDAAAHADVSLASTYDEAACDPSDSGECAVAVELEVMPEPPAILDCNDARANALFADMIGTCDMPRRSGPPLPPSTVRTGSSAPQLRLGDGARAGDRCPLPPPVRGDDSPSLPTARAPLLPAPLVTALAVADAPLPLRAEDSRLDRPPRL